MLISKFTLIMEFVDNIHEQMLKTKKSKISIQLPSYIKTGEFMKYVNDNSRFFKYTVEDGVVTCELIPENSVNDVSLDLAKRCCLHLKNYAKHIPELQKLIPKADEREELDEAGRKYMAQYYLDHPGEFNELLNNMIKIKENRLNEMCEYACQPNATFDVFKRKYLSN